MPTLTRRDVLRVSAALAATTVVVACTRGADAPSPTDPGGPEDPDRALRAEVGADERALVALYAAAAAVLTGRRATSVTTLGARHDAYRQAIDPDGLATRPASATATETGSTAPAPASSPATPRLTATTALDALRAAEQKAAAARAAQSVRAHDAELARVLALAGAGCAAADEALRRSP